MQYNPIAIFDIPVFPSQKNTGYFFGIRGKGDNMRRISLLWKVVRITYAERFAVGYVLLLFLVALALQWHIKDMGYGLLYFNHC